MKSFLISSSIAQHVSTDYDDNILTITALEIDASELESALNFYFEEDIALTVKTKNFNIREVGPTLGKTFRDQGVDALIVAFILMAVVIFFAFKDVVPSFAVMLAATCDAILALGAMSLLGIPLEPATLAAILMLIGYSVDSDIVLTAKVLKERMGGSVEDRINSAMKTGLTMTGTTLSVMAVIFVVSSTITQIPTFYNIAAVLLLGLTADLATTWFTNAGILKWHMESDRRFKKYKK